MSGHITPNGLAMIKRETTHGFDKKIWGEHLGASSRLFLIKYDTVLKN